MPPALMFTPCYKFYRSSVCTFLVTCAGFEGKGHRNEKILDLGPVLMQTLTAKAFDLNNDFVKKNQQENPHKPRKSKSLVQ